MGSLIWDMVKRAKKKKKKALSEIISMILFIMLALIAIGIVAGLVMHKIRADKEQIEVLQLLNLEDVQLQKAMGDFTNGGIVNITINRVFSVAPTAVTKANQTLLEEKPADIVLVLDRSGSMQQSGWVLETSPLPIGVTNLTVPRNGHSPVYSFSVPSGTQRLVVSITWNKVSGFNGSEGSELALNLRRPNGTWIANNGNKPDALGNKVDPPNSVGAPNEYFSGISTKPQYYYIENPQSGNWQAKIYGWNLRPKTNPPSMQDVSLQVYLGDSSSLNKSSTVISSDLVKSASKSFIDRLENKDRAAIVRFGSYAELTQSLSSNKQTVKNAIDNLGSEGGTNISDGIIKATQHLISNGKSDSLKIITILTDGQDDLNPETVLSAAQQAKNNNITIFTIGMTNFVNEEMLKSAATKSEYYYYSDFNELDKVYQQLTEKIQGIQESKTLDVSFVLIFSNGKSSCEKEIESADLPGLGLHKTYTLNLNGCIENVTKIEIHAKIKNKVGPVIDTIIIEP
jgi:Mg-chelatase subunit ChlD